MNEWRDTLLSQYANSPILLALIEGLNDAIDPGVDIESWRRKVWDIQTAAGYGLDIWGRIVDVGRILKVPGAGSLALGFAQAGNSATPFGFGSFYAGPPADINYRLSDEVFRKLILCKAYSNICNASIASYNRMLMLVFGDRGRAYVRDQGDMTAQLMFEFPLRPYERAIVVQSGAFTPPTGVRFTIRDFDPATTAGFAESGATATFGSAVFYAG